MKKLVIALSILAISTPVYAMAKAPANSYYGCLDSARTSCLQYGDPYAPNYPVYYKSEGICYTNSEEAAILKGAMSSMQWQYYGSKNQETIKKDLLLAQSGDPVGCAKRSAYDPSKPTYNAENYNACSLPIQNQCQCKFYNRPLGLPGFQC